MDRSLVFNLKGEHMRILMKALGFCGLCAVTIPATTNNTNGTMVTVTTDQGSYLTQVRFEYNAWDECQNFGGSCIPPALRSNGGN